MGIGNADDAGFSDLRMGKKDAFDLDGKDTFAAAANDFLPPPGDGEEPVGVEHAEITGEYPAVADRARRFFRIAPVSLHRKLAAHRDLPDATGRNVPAGVVHHSDFHVEVRPAHW